MKGVLLKEWYQVRKLVLFYGFIFLIGFLSAVLGSPEDPPVLAVCWAFAMTAGIGLSGMSQEDARWLSLVMTTGVSRRQYVRAKYLLGVCGQLLIALFMAAVAARFRFTGVAAALSLSVVAGLLVHGALSFPLLLRKARSTSGLILVVFLLLAAAAGVTVGLTFLGLYCGFVWIAAGIAAAALLYGLSYLLAARWFAVREF